MIEESTLPDGIARTGGSESSCKNALQSSNPLAQFNAIWQCHKQVQMIRKNHVAPNSNAEITLRAFAEFHECFMNTLIRKMSPAPVGAAGYEIKRAARKDNVEPSRRSREFCHDLV